VAPFELREEGSCQHQAAHQRATGMLNEFVTQRWLASWHRANCFGKEADRKTATEEHGAEEIEPSHQANNASPFGEYRLARKNVA